MRLLLRWPWGHTAIKLDGGVSVERKHSTVSLSAPCFQFDIGREKH